MNTHRVIRTVAVLLTLTVVAQADWNPDDPHKMHFPQLPDPQGWDVNFTEPKVLADDWKCSDSGPVSDVHLWFSSKGDMSFQIQNVHLSIHKDIPATATSYSMPGELLWERDFDPKQFSVRDWWETGDQGWYDPNTGEFAEFDHKGIFQLNIMDIPDPFTQDEGTIYWLDVTVVSDVPLGWKTTLDKWNDDAVWSDLPGEVEWQELIDPITERSLDLAFVIVPEPNVIAMIIITCGGFIFARRRFMI